MDTLGPRIMVNVGTQAVSNPGLNPRDLAPLTNDAFLATFMGKTSLSAGNGISRQHNNYRQSYTTQMERVTIRSKSRPLTSNNDSIEPDSAILSVIRGNGSDSNNQQQSSQRQLQGNNRTRRRSLNQQQLLNGWNDIPCSPNYRPTNDLNRRRRTRSGGALQQQQQITVVDQMAAQPHIPYAILPKRFEPKQVSSNGFSQQQQQLRSSNNNNNNNNNRRRFPRRQLNTNPRRSQRQQDYYDDQWVDEEDNDLWLAPTQAGMRRRTNRMAGPSNGYYGPRQPLNNYYNAYSYGQLNRQGQNSRQRMLYQGNGYHPFDIVPSYDLNEWQGPYARTKQSLYSWQQRGGVRSGRYNNNNSNGFIRDDHRVHASSRQSRNGQKSLTPTRYGKQAKSPRNRGRQQSKRQNSRQRKQRNQNSKTEGTPSTTNNNNENELKSSTETDKENQQKPLPPRDNQTNNENKSE